MIQLSEYLTRTVEVDRSDHALCSLTSALRLVAGKHIRVPKRAYPNSSPSRFARLLQVGNGACDLLLSVGRQRTLVSGEQLEYLAGDIEYFTGHCFRRWWRSLSVKRPFFVVSGSDPAESIAAITGCDARPNPRLCLSNNRCVVVIMANWSGTPAVLYYAGCEQAIAELRRQANGLAIASSNPQLRHLVPRLLTDAALPNGAAVIAQTRVRADPYKFSWRRIDAATELWLSRKPASENTERAWMDQRPARVCESLPGHRDLLLRAADALMEWRETTRIPEELTHGDFWLGNVLFDGDDVSGVIDWEWAQMDGLRVVDGLHMLLMSCAVAHGASIAHYLYQLWADEIEDVALQQRIANLCIQSGIDPEDLKFVALLLWFGILWQKEVRGGRPAALWSEKMITRTMPAIMKWLSRCSKTRGIRAATP
jgi:Phosphotransferase enzyme family